MTKKEGVKLVARGFMLIKTSSICIGHAFRCLML